jgi:hypothetical protein
MENYPDHPCDDQAKIPGNPLANRRRSPVVVRNLPGDVLQMSRRLSPDNPPDPHPPFGELSPVSRGIVPRLTGEFPLFGGGSTRGISPVATYTVLQSPDRVLDYHPHRIGKPGIAHPWPSSHPNRRSSPPDPRILRFVIAIEIQMTFEHLYKILV